jgi:hypothetical protein
MPRYTNVTIFDELSDSIRSNWPKQPSVLLTAAKSKHISAVQWLELNNLFIEYSGPLLAHRSRYARPVAAWKMPLEFMNTESSEFKDIQRHNNVENKRIANNKSTMKALISAALSCGDTDKLIAVCSGLILTTQGYDNVVTGAEADVNNLLEVLEEKKKELAESAPNSSNYHIIALFSKLTKLFAFTIEAKLKRLRTWVNGDTQNYLVRCLGIACISTSELKRCLSIFAAHHENSYIESLVTKHVAPALEAIKNHRNEEHAATAGEGFAQGAGAGAGAEDPEVQARQAAGLGAGAGGPEPANGMAAPQPTAPAPAPAPTAPAAEAKASANQTVAGSSAAMLSALTEQPASELPPVNSAPAKKERSQEELLRALDARLPEAPVITIDPPANDEDEEVVQGIPMAMPAL